MYSINGEVLQEVSETKYLGVMVSDDLKWSKHISLITGKANSTLAFLRCNLKSCPRALKETAYISMVCSVLEYCAPVWDPYLEGDKNNMEKIQRRAARMVCSDYRLTSSVTSMLKELGWESLEERRRELRLALMYKVVFGFCRRITRRHRHRSFDQIRQPNPCSPRVQI